MDPAADKYAAVFATLDRKGRGTVSRDDVIRALQILQFNPTLEEVECLLQKYPQHEFNYEQFVKLVAAETRLHSFERRKSDLRQAFAVFDCQNTGCLDAHLFRLILTQCGSMPLTEREAYYWIQRLDRRKDGFIRLAELEEVLLPDEELDFLLTQQNWVAV